MDKPQEPGKVNVAIGSSSMRMAGKFKDVTALLDTMVKVYGEDATLQDIVRLRKEEAWQQHFQGVQGE